ncbi:HAD family hydrolase [Citrobacter freundii]|uniref:phosphoserine phosphatase n=2 Tax=Enterobacteriaceae TaxID=543 RepID=A0AAD1WZJ2_CITFR|nr:MULTISPECIES: HAD-IB family phosphatase [Enterobacteriaceae]EAA7587454.1 HAD family hydrolase [Salmonella enterica]MDU1708318.1 HAD-IB family phosphatase [Anaerococcus vaginalis]MDU7723822.1 HAD-IB family phosphatase [Citrobacter sp.]RWT35580.1 HAD family hydrolase [Enterobacter cloacae]ASG46876.1 phosphoserine phosphatase [Citrobacter freundii]
MKICFFDMEGTLLKKNLSLDNGKVAPSAWTVLAKEISEACYIEEEKTKDLWLTNKYISYTQWMKETVEIQIKHGMNKTHLQTVLSQAELQKGAVELIQFLKKKGYLTVLISGGFKELADLTQRKLKIDHAYSACEYFFDKNGSVEHFNLLPTDEEGKLVFMKHLASEYNSELENCIFIGDGKNDVFIAKNVGTSIAFNAQKELKDVATFIVDQESPDLSAIINIISY